MNVSSFEKFSSSFDSTLLRHEAKTCKKERRRQYVEANFNLLFITVFFFVFNVRAEKVLFLGDSKASFQKLRAQNEAIDNCST